ncbi:hypothetical protein BDZ45DRAFT_666701 [Acephala macrosclerotiorum]|nr:hypothetical protein BDZ45DRAFT_666701 [Acephala macrosclerotiorum]
MDNTFDKTATETIDLLEARLRRIEYAVCSQINETSASIGKPPVAQRLASLEHGLHQLASKSRVIQDLLRIHSRYPDLFQAPNADDLPTTLDTESILAIVMASASSYPSTASRLTSILDVPIPSTELSTQLIELRPRIARLEGIQAAQNADLAELRERSATLIQRWYTMDVLRAGDSLADLEGRVRQAEQQVRRVSLARREDDGLV